jgi:hypothetical protein
LGIVAISANDIAKYPDDGPAKMVEEVALRGYTFPYLFDESQEVPKAYRAACTPDFFLFDADRRLVYRGQFDASRPSLDTPVDGSDLRAACDAVLAGEIPSTEQIPSVGCNIKWKAGNAPDRFAEGSESCSPAARARKDATGRLLRWRLTVAAQRDGRVRLEQRLHHAVRLSRSRSGDRLPVPGWTWYSD